MESRKLKRVKFSKFNMPKFTKKKIALLIMAGIVVIGGGVSGYNLIFSKDKSETVHTATVSKGDITVSVEGSGVIEPIEMYEITSLAKGEILKSDFEEGEKVKKGDLLYVVDTKDIDNNIEKAKVSLEKQKLSHSQTVEEYEGLSVKAPISGVITKCYVNKGDSVKNGTEIADIINSDYMILKIPFNSNDAANISVGDTAQVMLENSFYETTGTVDYVSSGEIVNDSGAMVSTVKIKIKNPGSITNEDKATAVINNMACNSSGTFDYSEKKTVTAKASGDVVNINRIIGDKVDSGDAIVELESDSAEVSLKQSELSLKDAELGLENTYDQLDDYNITSPIDGTVVEKTSKAGDVLDSDTKSTTMAVIADMSKLTFEIDVDELDIGKIKGGQAVQVTADSLEGRVFEGTIDNISAIGTSSDGVATYPVKVVMDYTDDLKIGMNVNAEIVIESKKDVLLIPSSALYRGNKVLVKDEDGSKAASQNKDENKTSFRDVPNGYTYVKVGTGVNNTDYVEITDGLEQGDVVIVPTEETSTTTNKQMRNGVMPGGGMPGGGMGGSPRGM